MVYGKGASGGGAGGQTLSTAEVVSCRRPRCFPEAPERRLIRSPENHSICGAVHHKHMLTPPNASHAPQNTAHRSLTSFSTCGSVARSSKGCVSDLSADNSLASATKQTPKHHIQKSLIRTEYEGR
jgi:hypothetical protein